MANITRIKAAPGIMVSVGRYTIVDTYQNVDLELLSDDTILGMQEEYEADRIIFEDYNIFKAAYDLVKSGCGSGTITEGVSTEAHQAAIIILLNNLITELQAKANTDEAQLVSLPESAATTAKQDTIITLLTSLLSELAAKANLDETQPVSLNTMPLASGAATATNQNSILASLDALLTELQAKASSNETQPVSIVTGATSTTLTVAASLDADTNIIPAGLLSVTIINNSTSAGAMTVSTANGGAALNPGEAVTFDAESTNCLLDSITVTGGFAITGRMFATKRST